MGYCLGQIYCQDLRPNDLIAKDLPVLAKERQSKKFGTKKFRPGLGSNIDLFSADSGSTNYFLLPEGRVLEYPECRRFHNLPD